MDSPAGTLVVPVLVLFGITLGICVALTWSHVGTGLSLSQRQAHERAEALLKEMLTDEEYAQLGQSGYLEVHSPSEPTRTYRVPRWPGRVAVLERGVEVECLCVVPVQSIPPGDVVLTHKLLIEGDEHEYLRRANHFRVKAPIRFFATEW